MAAAHTMTMRQQPTAAMYNPQHHSPAPMQSPHQDPHGRNIYASHPSTIYYAHYPGQQHNPYMQQAGIPQQPPLPTHNSMAPYQQVHQLQHHPPHPQQQQQHPQQSPHVDHSPRSKMVPSATIQRPISAQMGPPQIPPTTLPTPPLHSQQSPPSGNGQTAAPGPIPAPRLYWLSQIRMEYNGFSSSTPAIGSRCRTRFVAMSRVSTRGRYRSSSRRTTASTQGRVVRRSRTRAIGWGTRRNVMKSDGRWRISIPHCAVKEA